MMEEKKPKTKRQKIMSIISWVVLGFLVACVIFVTVSSLTNSIPSFFGYSFLTVKTGSMEPTIATNSVILVDRIDRTEVGKLKAGEDGAIVVYRANRNGYEITITHRIIENHYENGYVITKGDANDKDDGNIQVDDVVAVYRKTLPVLSFVVGLLSSTVGFAFLVFLPCLGLIGIQIYSAFYTHKQMALEKAENERVEKLKKEAVEEYIKQQNNSAIKENESLPDLNQNLNENDKKE